MYNCSLPGGQWINLAFVRRIQIDTGNTAAPDRRIVLVTWFNGDSNLFYGDEAIALIDAYYQNTHLDNSNVESLVTYKSQPANSLD